MHSERKKPVQAVAVPQFEQKRAPLVFWNPQAEQNFGAGARLPPHSAQNFPEGTLALQEGQSTRPPAAP